MAIRGHPMGHQTTGPPARRVENAEAIQRQYLWNTPNGSRPDFSETYTDGDEIVISWNALNNSVYDLWLTSWAADPDQVALCLARAVSLDHDGNLKLVTSDPPSAEMANETRYVLRFKPPTSQGGFVSSDPDLSSPGFLLLRSSVNSSVNAQGVRSSSVFATTTAAPTRSSVTPSRNADPSAAVPEQAKPDMSSATAAALTIGLILVVAFLVAMEVAYLMWRRKRRRGGEKVGMPSSSQRKSRGRGKSDSELLVHVYSAEMATNDALWLSPELPGDSDWGERLVHELQGSRLARGNPPGRSLTVNSSLVELEGGRR
ncbi:hypothetical protein C8A03DRAFT_36583 [Achaetomium macrosporum]|uniref:Uncharacterized protein n=1 Tax=Achaetomium macrosporum TaxID=79813 RepID=A0AAN7C6Z3_9PEZI|nr:hypothetical protein C8A03DRAFT_36583 [Achaetomium macrosporum]